METHTVQVTDGNNVHDIKFEGEQLAEKERDKGTGREVFFRLFKIDQGDKPYLVHIHNQNRWQGAKTHRFTIKNLTKDQLNDNYPELANKANLYEPKHLSQVI